MEENASYARHIPYITWAARKPINSSKYSAFLFRHFHTPYIKGNLKQNLFKL